jgi:hypothetical protein
MLLSSLDQEYTIPEIQATIERAWQQGIDPQGAQHFQYKLKKGDWIGATECAVFFHAIGIGVRIHDFYSPLHVERVVQEILDYPLYLQYHGHSITIIGVPLRVLDPERGLVPWKPTHSQYQMVQIGVEPGIHHTRYS